MKFKSLDSSVKRQIKASMKRIAQKFIKLNIEKADKMEYVIAFNIWTNRYISSMNSNKYYNLISVDEELFQDLRSIMEDIFTKEASNMHPQAEVPELKHSRFYVEKPATLKQIYYAKYLMDTVKNEPLPNKKYSMYEIGLLIKDLKSQIKTS